MTVSIMDQYGNRWAVSSAEPATKHVSRLTRNNYGLIVLPARLLATGIDDGMTPHVEDLVMRVRLMDCLDLLRKGA